MIKNSYIDSTRLLKERLNGKFKISDLGAQLNLSSSNISEIESGKKGASIKILVEYCLFFDLSPFDIINKSYSVPMVRSYVAKLESENIIDAKTANKILEFHKIK
jgi:transcriptional regulator with XRE-family HTH domain